MSVDMDVLAEAVEDPPMSMAIAAAVDEEPMLEAMPVTELVMELVAMAVVDGMDIVIVDPEAIFILAACSL